MSFERMTNMVATKRQLEGQKDGFEQLRLALESSQDNAPKGSKNLHMLID